MSEILNSWTGKWRWNADTAEFSDPHHENLWQEQTQEITVRDNTLLLRTYQVFNDGSKRSWLYDGAFDGKARPILWEDDGSVMAIINFIQVNGLMCGDAFEIPGANIRGSEYFIIGQDNVQVRGCTTANNQQYTYFEEWDRIG